MVKSDKQRKKNITLSVSLLALVVSCVLAGLYGGSSSSLKVDPGLFRVDDFTTIDSIVMDGVGEPVAVHFDSRRWRVNGRHPADLDLVEVLFATLQQAVPKRPVATGLQDSLSSSIDRNGIDVLLFSGGTLVKSFKVGANASQSETWFMGQDNIPYVMTIPGYRVFVAGILSLGPPQWRDKFIFGFNAANFQRLDASFPRDSRQAFAIVMTAQGPEIEGMADADTTRLFDFLDNVARLTVDEFGKKHDDAVFSSLPAMQIVVTDIANRTSSVALFAPGPGNQPFGGIVNGSDTASLDPRKVDPIMKSRDFFALPN